MGVLICLYDWPDQIDWIEAQGKCDAAMARLGYGVERYVYEVESSRTRVRKSPLSRPVDGQWYVGAYSFNGGEVNVPCPHASAVCLTSHPGKTFYLFDALKPFEQKPVAGLSEWLAEMWPGAVGYALPHDRVEGPEAFAIGAGNAHPPRSTEDTTAWFVDRRDNPATLRMRLRDLFEVNILHPAVLARTFAGQTLENWIRDKRERGQINRGNANVVVWTIELEHLSMAREEARNSGITYPRNPSPRS